METNKTIITECYAITLFNNFKKFYNAFRKINNIKIEKKRILDFLHQLLELEYYEYSPKDKQPTQDAINEYGILPK